MKPETSRSLKKGTRLPHNYIIEKRLGEGGFGITYYGYHSETGEKVAIKEYFPGSLAYRNITDNGKLTVVPYQEQAEAYRKGLKHFLDEASILKEFQHLNSVVSVKDILQANGTTYLVMEYIDGITLKQYVQENGTLPFDDLLNLMTPVIQALIQIHQKGLIHRDISPENLMVGTDNQLHLIDFGAAGFETAYEAQTRTIILKSGYAPPEQYLRDGKQGAFTDVYALCATMYYALTGLPPTESIHRMQKDELPSLAANSNISSWQAAAIEKGMALFPADRYSNMEALYQALRIPPMDLKSKRTAYLTQSIENNQTVIQPVNAGKSAKKRQVLFAWIGFAAVLLLILAFSLKDSILQTSSKNSQTAISTENSTDNAASSENNSSGVSASEENTAEKEQASSTEKTTQNTSSSKEKTTEKAKVSSTEKTTQSASSSEEKATEKDQNSSTEKNTKSGSSNQKSTTEKAQSTQAPTTEKTTQSKGFSVSPIEEDDEYSTIKLK